MDFIKIEKSRFGPILGPFDLKTLRTRFISKNPSFFKLDDTLISCKIQEICAGGCEEKLQTNKQIEGGYFVGPISSQSNWKGWHIMIMLCPICNF